MFRVARLKLRELLLVDMSTIDVMLKVFVTFKADAAATAARRRTTLDIFV